MEDNRTHTLKFDEDNPQWNMIQAFIDCGFYPTSMYIQSNTKKLVVVYERSHAYNIMVSAYKDGKITTKFDGKFKNKYNNN